MKNDLSEKIRRLRLDRDMTLEQVASIVGVGKSTVRKWETGAIANMRRDKIASLAAALGTTPAYLMGWNDDPTPDTSPVSENRRKLLEFVESVPEDKAARVLRLMQAILEDEQ